MITTSAVTSITDKGYILLPVKVRRALNLKPRQTVTVTVVGDKMEVEPMLTLDQVFAMVKPNHRPFTQKELKAEEKMAHEAIAKNAASEGV